MNNSSSSKYVRNNITSKIPNWNAKWGKITRRIGNVSENGAVFATENPLYAVKIQPNSKMAKEESLILKELNVNNVPKFFKNYIVNVNNASKTNLIFKNPSTTSQLRVIVMEMLRATVPNTTLMTVDSYYSEYGLSKHNGEKIKQTIRQLQSKGIFHGNMHMENIMVIVDNKTKRIVNIKIIDFGRSKRARMLRSVNGSAAEDKLIKHMRLSSKLEAPYHVFYRNGPKENLRAFLPTKSSIQYINEMINGVYYNNPNTN